MKPPTICGNAVSENLHALAADLVNPRGRAMDRWDEIRRQVETHKGSDLPRLNYEGVLEDFSEQFAEGAKEIERLTAENEAIRKDRDDLLQQALGVEAERDIARMENERLRAALREVRTWFVEAEVLGYGPIDEVIVTALGDNQQTTPQPEKPPHFREMRGIFKEEGK